MMLLVLACFVTEDEEAAAYDRDGDGYLAEGVGGEDCDDQDDAVFPGAFESCLDSIDSDCDGFSCIPRVDTTLSNDAAWATGQGRLVARAEPLDLDGDGVLELLLSEPAHERGRGRVTQLGLPLDELEGAELIGEENGLVARRAGDLDGDGDDEALLTTELDEGLIWVLDDPLSGTEDLLAALGPGISEGGIDNSLSFGGLQTLPAPDGEADRLLFMNPSGGDANHGTVYLLGEIPPDVESLADVALAVVRGHEADRLGASAGEAGDFDGDGIADALIVAPGAATIVPGGGGQPGTEADHGGAAYLFDTQLEGELQPQDADVVLQGLYDNEPVSLATSAGDVDADGYDDLAVHLDNGPGAVVLFHGPLRAALNPGMADLRLSGSFGETRVSSFGSGLQGRDVDGDGHADLLVASPEDGFFGGGETAPAAGSVFLYLGPLEGVISPDHARARWSGDCGLCGLGSDVVVWDLDEDGTLDLLLSAPGGPGGQQERIDGQLHLLPDAFEAWR